MKNIIDKYNKHEQLDEAEEMLLLQTILEVKGNRERQKHYRQLIAPSIAQTNKSESKKTTNKWSWWSWMSIAALLILVPFLLLLLIPDEATRLADNYLAHMPAITPTVRGDVQDAQIVLEAKYVEGMQLLQEKKYAQAIAALETVPKGNYWNDAQWYLALAHIQQRDNNKACSSLQQLNPNEPKVAELMQALACK